MTDSAPTIAQPARGAVAKTGALLDRVRRCAHAVAATSSCGEPAPQHAACGGGLGGAGGDAAAAHAGLGEDEVDLAGGLPVAGEGGDDGADLLVAGAQQEGRRAAVALHADDVDALVGVGELLDAVRRHRAARVHVRVDQRSERARCLDAVVEVEPQLGQQREVGAEAGGGDHLVGDQRTGAVAELQPAVALGDVAGVEAGDQLEGAVVDQAADGLAERAACGQLVGAAAAELVARRRRRAPPTRSACPARPCAARPGRRAR